MSTTRTDTDQIGDLQVTVAKLAGSAVTAPKIAANAVLTGKINAGAVTTAKLGNGAVTNAKVNGAAAIAESKIALSRSTASLLQGHVNSGLSVWGNMTITTGNVFVDVTFSGGFTFTTTNFSIAAQRTSSIPLDIYIHAVTDTWADTKAADGFRFHIATPEAANATYDYICIGI